MSKIALDTNILLYLYDFANDDKRQISESLLSLRPLVSVQVISEFLNAAKRILKKDKHFVLNECLQMLRFCNVASFDQLTMRHAQFLLNRYDFQLFDSIIIASALNANCEILYSEDFQHKQVIEKRLTIINPFL